MLKEVNEVGLSLTDFLSQLQRHRREIMRAWDSISPIYEQFAHEEDIYAEHCDYVRNAIREMNIPVRNLYYLLHTSSLIPEAVVPYSFSPLITLRQADELSDELLILIPLFRNVCRLSSQDTLVRRQEIINNLYALAQGYEGILQDVDHLLLQVLAQEKAKRQKLKSVEW
jgi:hypothetical protein